MKISRLLAGTTLVTALLVPPSAMASLVNYDYYVLNGSAEDIGSVQTNQSGTIGIGHYGNAPYVSIDATLPGDNSILFDFQPYNISGYVSGTICNQIGYYYYSASSYVFDINGLSVDNTLYNGPGNLLSASGSTMGTIVLANLTASPVTINFTGDFLSRGGSLSYSVSSLAPVSEPVSAVPLPASFPMFAAVLAGLAGFSFYRKRRML